ncbi:haloacid dehalogenase-like hydrolase, partial [Sinorhizobium meliloti]|nr:haloacid dehalogenase-like hydrolase [Sinorhizobium meliloti]MDX0217414.1 haloacid dehalogenase-like hydrolase [Sinorhizobium meliloti]
MLAVHDFLKSAQRGAVAIAAALLLVTSAKAQSDPLPSWNDTAPKAAIVAFVEKVTTENS